MTLSQRLRHAVENWYLGDVHARNALMLEAADALEKPHRFCPDCGQRNAPGLIHTCSPTEPSHGPHHP